MSRNRLEDLGRLSVIIDNILDHEIFREERMMAHDFEKWFESQTVEKRQAYLDRIAKAIPEIEGTLEEALKIAKGIDALNGSSRHA